MRQIYNKKLTEQKLIETFNYYNSEDNNRCTALLSCLCYYSPEVFIKNELDGDKSKTNTQGCAIGRLLSKNTQLWADTEVQCFETLTQKYKANQEQTDEAYKIKGLFIPKFLLNNELLWYKIQGWHDNHNNFEDGGQGKCSSSGLFNMRDLARDYGLSKLEAIVNEEIV